MKRHDEGNGTAGMAQSNMAPALAHDHPAETPKRRDQLGTRDDREPVAQAGSDSRRRMTPISSDAVLPEAGRTAAGYRVFGPDAVGRARLIRTLRELGVGLDDIKGVLAAEVSLLDVAAEHVRALDAQIRLLGPSTGLSTAEPICTLRP